MTYKFDPEFTELLQLLPEEDLLDNPVAARAGMNEMVAAANLNLDESGVNIENRLISREHSSSSVPVRIYQPEGADTAMAGLIYIHGGGFVVGDLESEHSIAIELCRELGIVIVSVDYRLAPEHPYPAGLEDCYTTLCWTHANASELHVDTSRIGVCGSSAGGGLAAGLALLSRDRNGPALCFQFLGIPELDDRLETQSMKTFVDTPLWSRTQAIKSWEYYLMNDYVPGSDDVPEYAAPARAMNLSNLPPAYVSTMEFDPLRDEGIEYALRLLQAGVAVELHSYPGTFHGSFLINPQAAVCQRERQEMKVALRRGLSL